MPNLGILKEITDLRSVWSHEALNFTPWVAENVDLLVDAVGLDITVDIAPAFTVVERPNDWTKEIKKTTATKPTQQQRLEYWNAFNEYAFQNMEFARAFRSIYKSKI